MKKTISLAVALSVLSVGSAFAGYRQCTDYAVKDSGKNTMMCLSDAEVTKAQSTNGTDVKCTGSLDYADRNTCHSLLSIGAPILGRIAVTDYNTFING